jgi:hypothetical protein
MEGRVIVASGRLAGAPSRWRTQYEDHLSLCIEIIAALNPPPVLDTGACDGIVPNWLSSATQDRAELTGLGFNALPYNGCAKRIRRYWSLQAMTGGH